MANFTLLPFSPRINDGFLLTAEFNQSSDAFFVSFLIHGNLSTINLGSPTPHKERIIKLWEKTCFELFMKNSRDEYLEFNFSPCFEWNCFYFKQQGDALAEWSKMQRPQTDILLSLDKFFIVCEIKKEFLPKNFLTVNHMSVGLSSVLKMNNEEIIYWALSHQDKRPNFHHFDSFKYKF
jgi:hypothetical protein